MSTASPKVQELARRLLDFEESRESLTSAQVDVVVQVIEELRLRLVRLAGVVGFRSLLSRALTLAKAEAPSLKAARVNVDGSLEGFVGIEQSQETAVAVHARTILVAHLLELLVTFIGEPLTLRLIRDRWPDASIDDAETKTGENHEHA